MEYLWDDEEGRDGESEKIEDTDVEIGEDEEKEGEEEELRGTSDNSR